MRREDKQLVIDNIEIYQYYKERLINLALSQFEYQGLPETCDRLYFERRLLFDGRACMLNYGETGEWYSLGVMPRSNFDLYGYPAEIYGIDFNAKQYEPDGDKWVMLYDNMTRQTLLPKIDLYAKLLWEVHNTFRSNLQHQINPFIVATTKNQLLSIKNIFNRIFGFQPVIEIKNTDNIEDCIKAFNLGVEYKGNDLLTTLKTIWAEALSMLGITAETTKKERMISDEITINRQEDILSLNSRLLNRVIFCNKMNERFGFNMTVNMSSQDISFKPFGDYAMRAIDTMDEGGADNG